MFFISSKKLSLFSRYSNFLYFPARSFSPYQSLPKKLIEEYLKFMTSSLAKQPFKNFLFDTVKRKGSLKLKLGE